MKTNNTYCQWALSAASFLFATIAQAVGSIPSITIAPLTAGGNIIFIAPGNIATVDYKITNNIIGQGPQWTWNNTTSYLSRANSGGSGGLPDCGGTTFTQAQGSSCIFRLHVNGTAFAASNQQVPASTPNFISGMVNYGPSENNQLSVSVSLPTTLSVSVLTLGLSVNNTTLNAALTGQSRYVTIQNTGLITATGLSIPEPVPALPTGSTWSTTCGTTLAPSATCTITITPAAASTTNCATGIAPTPSVFSISANNVSTVITNVVVLSYGCIYQGGFVYSVDDSAPDSGSIGGQVVTTIDQATAITWTAAGTLCSNYTGGNYTNWSLPAICEMGYKTIIDGNPACGTSKAPTFQNIQSNIVDSGIQSITGLYWSSTEVAPSNAWIQTFEVSPTPSSQNPISQTLSESVRCSRALTQ